MEIAIDDARAAQEEHLQEPVQQDGYLAEEKPTVNVGRHQHIVEREQRHRQNGDSAENIVEIGDRGEPPLVAVQVEDEIDHRRVDQEDRQEFETGQPFIQRLALEPDKKRQYDRRRGCGEIVQHDQNLARGQLRQWQPFPDGRELYREFAVYSVFQRRGSCKFDRISRGLTSKFPRRNRSRRVAVTVVTG